jgi:hypothetical protein
MVRLKFQRKVKVFQREQIMVVINIQAISYLKEITMIELSSYLKVCMEGIMNWNNYKITFLSNGNF